MRYFRFEIGKDGSSLGIGFLSGLDEIQENELDYNEQTRILDLFDSLPSPFLSDCGVLQFWFTEAGVKAYALAIEMARDVYERNGFQLIVSTFKAGKNELAIYHDKFQIALPKIVAEGYQAEHFVFTGIHSLLQQKHAA